MKKSTLLVSLAAAAAMSTPIAAQVSNTEQDPVSNYPIAIDAGYQIVRTADHKGSEERELVDETFMKAINEAYGNPELPYGFSFIWRDLTGDGQADVILVPKMANLYPPAEYADSPGAAVFVYVRTPEGAWDLAIEAGTMSIGLRPGEIAGSVDIAFVQEMRMDEFFWNGSEFIKRASRTANPN